MSTSEARDGDSSSATTIDSTSKKALSPLLSVLQQAYYYSKLTVASWIMYALWIGNTSRAPIYFNGYRLSLSAFRACKVQMYFGILRLSLHSICGTWSVLDIGFYNFSIPFASKATLLCKVY